MLYFLGGVCGFVWGGGASPQQPRCQKLKHQKTDHYLDCSQPLYFSTYAKEKASKASASAKHKAVGAGRQAKRAKRAKRPTPSSLPFCAGVQFSRDSIRAFNDRKIYEKMEGCEQSNHYYASAGLCSKVQLYDNTVLPTYPNQ